MISVAIATFNGAEYLPPQLDSILAQSVAVDEIVICDDNSADGTVSILENYQKEHPGKFRIFRNPQNLGCAGNFEKALSLCSGDIIFLADQDDVWLADKVEKMLKCFTTPQILGVYSDSLVVNAKLEPQGKTHLEIRNFSPDLLKKLPQFKNFIRRVPPAAHDMAIRKTALKYLLPFPKQPNVHDSFIGITIAALNGWEMIPECLTLFRQHGANASGSGKSDSGIAGQLRAAKQSAKSDTFAWNAKLHAFVLARLKDRIDDENETLLKARVVHSQSRSKMGKCNWFHRAFLVGIELFSGNYFRFARGIKSVIQDLFLR